MACKGESISTNPNELYDDFEKSMPIPIVTCSDYASSRDFVNAASELYDFNKALKDFFSPQILQTN